MATDKFTAEERALMHEIFVRTLEEERTGTPSRDTTHIQTAGITPGFPNLTHEEVAELALEELATNWYKVPGQEPYTTPGQSNWIIWFTDDIGYRRLQGR
jgi:hypothetical protein